jgi:hypothetical protein
MDFLFKKLKKAADEITANPELFTDHYRHCVNHGFIKLREYYSLTDESRIYRAAVALHPCYRFEYFERAWHNIPNGSREIKRAKQAVEDLFSEYVDRARNDSFSSPATTPPISHEQDEDWLATFKDHTIGDDENYQRRKRRKQESELERFMEDELDTKYAALADGKRVVRSYFNQPLAWWKDRGEALYPTLATMAYDLFSIPGRSSECERAFSAGKKMITDERYQLNPDIIEADQCLKSWLKQGVVDGAAAWQTIAGDEPAPLGGGSDIS